MAELKEIIDKEKLREDKQQFLTVHLYQDGNFYRAYDWSAWLCVNYIKSDMKVTHRKTKTTDIDFCFVGFPMTSIDKYTPEGARTERTSEKSLDILLEEDLIDDSVSYETLLDAVEKWKNGMPIAMPSDKKKNKDQTTADYPPEINDVLREILAYPIESRTPIDNIIFISKLKEVITNIIF